MLSRSGARLPGTCRLEEVRPRHTYVCSVVPSELGNVGPGGTGAELIPELSQEHWTFLPNAT